MTAGRIWVRLAMIFIVGFGVGRAQAQDYVRDSEPKLISYEELVQLSVNQELPRA